MNHMLSFENEKAGIIQHGRPFIKMHGLRNDFIIVDGRRQPYRPSTEEVIRICDRHEGVGGDELLILNPPGTMPESADSYAFVRIYNPDGREVEACGNATRCVGWLFLQESQAQEVVVETLGGLLKCRRAGAKQVAVEMGMLRTAWQDIPLSHAMDTLHLEIGAGPLQDPVGMNIGNPHEFTVLEFANLVRELIGEAEFIFEPLPEDDPLHRQPDIHLANERLGWAPKTQAGDPLRS